MTPEQIYAALFLSKDNSVWIDHVCAYYDEYYDMGGSEPDMVWLKAVLPILKKFCPEQYKTGVHLLARSVCSLGEDLWWVDEAPQHPIHFHHLACGKHSILWRKAAIINATPTKGQSVHWCGHCQRVIGADEMKSDYEEHTSS